MFACGSVVSCAQVNGYTWADVGVVMANQRRGGTKKGELGKVAEWLKQDMDFACIPRVTSCLQVLAAQAGESAYFADTSVGVVTPRH